MNTFPLLLNYPLADPSVVAFSTTRHGGCGGGTYATFNCTPYTGDEPMVVSANQKQLCRQLGISADNLILPYQTHSCNVLVVDDAFMCLTTGERHLLLQEKDAVMTNVEGVCVCVSTADCIPILLYDATHRAIAAIHAGWRGTVNRFVMKTMQAMHHAYGTNGEDVHAIIGPGISLDAFEVGKEVYDAFQDAGFEMQQIARWYPEAGKSHLNLPKANRLQLVAEGVPETQIYDSGVCTYGQHRDFFSARRLGIKSGRILNGIMLNKK